MNIIVNFYAYTAQLSDLIIINNIIFAKLIRLFNYKKNLSPNFWERSNFVVKIP